MTPHWSIAYIGCPWVSGAAGPDAYDCHGLVRAVYRDAFGIVLPVVEVDALNPRAVCCAVRDYDYSGWQELAAPDSEFDVVQMSYGNRPHHVGLFIEADGGGVLSAVEGAGVVFQSLTSLRQHGWNIVSAYRHRGRA